MKKAGKNSLDIKENNRYQVLQTLIKNKSLSRAELSKILGLQRSTMTNIINELMEVGLVVETGLASGKKGRRIIGLTVNTVDYRLVSVRLARKYFTVIVFNLLGEVIAEENEKIEKNQEANDVMLRIVNTINCMMQYLEDKKVLGIGVTVPGPMKSLDDIGLVTEFPGWEDISVKDILSKEFEWSIYLEHDAKAGALAQWWYDDTIDERDSIMYVAAGQGVGSGIIIRGKLLRGKNGTAGEIGHMSIDYSGEKCVCGNRGCLEKYCSSIALLNKLKENLEKYPGSSLNAESQFEDVVEAYKQGDKLAVFLVNDVSYYLGIGIGNLINIFNFDVVIIADDLSKLGKNFLEQVIASVKEHCFETNFEDMQIKLSELSTDPVSLGMCVTVIEKTISKLSADIVEVSREKIPLQL